MRKILAYLLTSIYALFFILTLVVFHPIQWICLNAFGYQAHKISVDWLQFFLLRCLNLLGTRFTFQNDFNIPTNQPIIIIANHQSNYDVITMSGGVTPGVVSVGKKSLKWVPLFGQLYWLSGNIFSRSNILAKCI